MGTTVLKFKSKGMTNSLRVQSGVGVPSNVLGVFSDDTVGLSVTPCEIRCFPDAGFLGMGDLLVFLDDEALAIVHAFLTAQFKERGIYWGC